MKGLVAFKKRLNKIVDDKYPGLVDDIIADVKKSGCKNIVVKKLFMNAGGVSCANGDVIINDNFSTLSDFLFILEHELGHQYQYRKYGKDLSSNIWFRSMTEPILDIAKEVKVIEDVANRFADMRFSKLSKKYNLPGCSSRIVESRNGDIYMYQYTVEHMSKHLKFAGVKSADEVENVLIKLLC
jgi:hypothetical protein